jgi:hypothetical protein
MARKISNYRVSDEGRDQGKVFVLTEMPARRAADWATRALLAMGKSNVEIPAHVMEMGMEGIAVMGFQALLRMDYYDAKPLLDELLGCVLFLPDPNAPNVTRGLVDTDTEEVATVMKLYWEVFDLHTGFSQTVARWRQGQATKTSPTGSSNTPTSPEGLRQ